MACGHCRRPRKKIVAFNFDQLCGIRGLSSSPKSKGLPNVVLRGSKMAAEIGSWEPQKSPSRPEAHPGRALALPAPRNAPGSVRAAADSTPPGGGPGLPPRACQPLCLVRVPLGPYKSLSTRAERRAAAVKRSNTTSAAIQKAGRQGICTKPPLMPTQPFPDP